MKKRNTTYVSASAWAVSASDHQITRSLHRSW